MFYGGMCFSLFFLGICIILFKKNHVAELARDVLDRKRKPVEYDVQEGIGFCQELVTDVLVMEEACAEQFFEVVENVVVTHTNQTIEERSCL